MPYESYTECLKIRTQPECEMIANARLQRSVFVDELNSEEIRTILKEIHKPLSTKFIRFLKFAEKPLLVSFPSPIEK